MAVGEATIPGVSTCLPYRGASWFWYPQKSTLLFTLVLIAFLKEIRCRHCDV